MLSVTTTSLPNGTVGVPYSTTLAATGGTTNPSGIVNYTWRSVGAPLPAGLSLSPNGTISGTPSGLIPTNTTTVTSTATSFTTTNLIFSVTDGFSGPVRSQPLSLTINQTATTTNNWWPWVLGAGVFIVFILIVVLIAWASSRSSTPDVVSVAEPIPAQTPIAYTQATPGGYVYPSTAPTTTTQTITYT